MPDGGSIRLELIIRTITVVLELRLPIPVEVLGDAVTSAAASSASTPCMLAFTPR
jgi:hypothetical protein